jgi:hypothetical protein
VQVAPPNDRTWTPARGAGGARRWMAIQQEPLDSLVPELPL